MQNKKIQVMADEETEKQIISAAKKNGLSTSAFCRNAVLEKIQKIDREAVSQ